jgi:TonB family protein
MYNGRTYIEKGYDVPLLMSFVCAALIVFSVMLLLPEETVHPTNPNVKTVMIELTNINSIFDGEASDGGGGGGGPEKTETKTSDNTAVPLLTTLANPVATDKQDSTGVPDIDIPVNESGLGIGTGNGSGIGTGIGSGMGNGIGNSIGDGTGGSLLPPRPIFVVIPEYPQSIPKKQLSGTIQLSVRVNVDGKVDSAVVMENPTGSQVLAKLALQAAYASRYQPARAGNKAITCWTKCEYRFTRPEQE